jgi:hypothetical protein
MALSAFYFFAIAILILGCGAKHKLINDVRFQDENFRYGNLKSNGMIVAGLSSDVVEISREDRLEYSSTFSNVLLEKLKDIEMIQLTNPMQLIEKMGTESYFNMMEDFDRQKALSVSWADTLGVILPDIQYILFAYIVNENILDESHEYEVEAEEGKELRKEYEKTYFITVDFLLYDLFQQSVVWENSIFNKAHRTESRTTETGCFESCMNDIFQQILYGEPAEISREEVFVKIVEKFAEDIAKT